MTYQSNYDELISWIEKRHPQQSEYIQAVREVAADVIDIYNANENYKRADVLRRLCVPERLITFNISWQNANGDVEINQGWRVQHSGLIGPYKGGLRFHPHVNESVLKFLAFEQTFKNALTHLPIGGAKGGADFNPKGRSEKDIMRFCQAYMTELQHHIGARTDVPAGDINVGAREIGYLYGQYRRLKNAFDGIITGKGIDFGGSHVRVEATGFGLLYFLEAVLAYHDDSLDGKAVAISGAGNVALHAALKAAELGARVVSLSNSQGCLHCESGFTREAISFAITQRSKTHNILSVLSEKTNSIWKEGKTAWHIPCDIALPCATQNELDQASAKMLVKQGCQYVLEGANMPCTDKAHQYFRNKQIVHVPGKASNAGGVALSSMEMAQNAAFQSHHFDELDTKLKSIMRTIHDRCVDEGKRDGRVDYTKGANIAAFRRLADAMVAQGIA